MKIFRLSHQHKWHIVDPLDNNHSICKENFNANPRVVETEPYVNQKLCNICVNRAYKRGYLGVYPKFVQTGFNKISPINSEANIKRLYNPENNWRETLISDRTNVFTEQKDHLANQFFGFLVEELKGKDTGTWTREELLHDLLSKEKHTHKQKLYWQRYFLGDIDLFRFKLLEQVFPDSTYFKDKREQGYGVRVNYQYAKYKHTKLVDKILSYSIVKEPGFRSEFVKETDLRQERHKLLNEYK